MHDGFLHASDDRFRFGLPGLPPSIHCCPSPSTARVLASNVIESGPDPLAQAVADAGAQLVFFVILN